MTERRISPEVSNKKIVGTAKFFSVIDLCRGASPERAGKCACDEQDEEDEKKHFGDGRRQTCEGKKSQKASHQGKEQKRQGPTEHRGVLSCSRPAEETRAHRRCSGCPKQKL